MSGGGGSVPSSDATPPSVPLAPGFRFHPTDEELVIYYLKRRILGRSLRVDAIAEIDLYKCEPWDLPARSRIRSRDTEWYFFSALDRKYANKSRTNRATAMGYWKTTGKDREVRHGSRVVGMKKTLVFHAGRAPRGDRTNWVMHEYRLEGEEIPNAAVSQDSFVVCRVFQKSGSGPQNGAQYGAPFVEEEWAEETDTVALEVNDGEKEEYLQMNDFSQIQDQVNQHDTLPHSAPSSIESDETSHVDDPVGLTEVVKTEPNIIDDMIEFYELEQENSLELDNNAGEPAIAAESSSSPCQNGQYVELNDLEDVVNLDFPYSDDSATWPLKTCYKQNFVNGIDSGSNLQDILDVEEFFDTMNEDSNSQEPTVLCDNSYLATNFYSSEQGNENNVFYDASCDDPVNGKDEFVHLNGPLPTPISSSSGFDMVDELFAYFDTTENMLGSVDNLEATDAYLPNFTQQVDATCNATSMVLEANDQCGASSSAGPSDAINKLNEKTKDLTPVSDIPMDDIGDKSIRKHLVHMLGSISAPPALAEEFCAGPGKSIAPISAAHSASSSVRVTAGIIQIGGLTFPGNTPKNGDYGFLISYSIDGSLPTKSVEYDPITKMNGSAIATIFHSGFYLFFVSTLILAVSYKLGVCFYNR